MDRFDMRVKVRVDENGFEDELFGRKITLDTTRDKCLYYAPRDDPTCDYDTTRGTDVYVHRRRKKAAVYYLVHWSMWEGESTWLEVVDKKRALRYARGKLAITQEDLDEEAMAYKSMIDNENDDVSESLNERQSEIDWFLRKILREEGWNTWIPAFDEGEDYHIDIVNEKTYDPREFTLYSIPVSLHERVHRKDLDDFYEWYREYKKEEEKGNEKEVQAQ